MKQTTFHHQGFMKSAQGSASILVLLFGVTASIAMGAVVMSTGYDFMNSQRRVVREQALAIAEAGVNYYRWHLAHDPTDYQDGTGQPGPYVHEFEDPEGGVVGSYSLEIIPPDAGYTNVTIESTGWITAYPDIRRTVRVQYGIPSLAQYSFLHDKSVWFGQGLTVHGRALSNNGIRQDGINDSIIASSLETYTCGTETGCNPPTVMPAVWGSGGPQDLWQVLAQEEDFSAVSVDFANMRAAAEDSNTFWGPGDDGYHLVFQADGTVRVYEVTSTRTYNGYDDGACHTLRQRVNTEVLRGTYNLSEKSLFFFEDTVWVEGVVNGKATVVAARFPIDTYNEDMWIRGNVTYLAKNGDHSLGLIAQRNIYFVKDLPNDFEIDAAMLAQKGKIIRHHYGVGFCGSYSNRVRNSLSIYGSVISYLKSYWNWGTPPSSGFTTREVVYDADLYLNPPPYFPTSNGDYEVISWDEE